MADLPSLGAMKPWTSQNVVGAKECPGEFVWVCCVTVSVMVKKVDCEAASLGVAVASLAAAARRHLAHLRISLRTRNNHTMPNNAMVLWVTVMATTSPDGVCDGEFHSLGWFYKCRLWWWFTINLPLNCHGDDITWRRL